MTSFHRLNFVAEPVSWNPSLDSVGPNLNIVIFGKKIRTKTRATEFGWTELIYMSTENIFL